MQVHTGATVYEQLHMCVPACVYMSALIAPDKYGSAGCTFSSPIYSKRKPLATVVLDVYSRCHPSNNFKSMYEFNAMSSSQAWQSHINLTVLDRLTVSCGNRHHNFYTGSQYSQKTVQSSVYTVYPRKKTVSYTWKMTI